MSFESGVSDSVDLSEDVDGCEDGTRLLICVFGGRVLCGLGRKACCDPPKLPGLLLGEVEGQKRDFRKPATSHAVRRSR